MDKRMINIDDLVRQRLSGAEEGERPGGWLQMHELLDKKMPVNVGGMVNTRRMFSYAAALLLLTSVTVGGYQMLSSSRNLKNSAPLAISAATGTNAPHSHLNGNTQNTTLTKVTAVDNGTSRKTAGRSLSVAAGTHKQGAYSIGGISTKTASTNNHTQNVNDKKHTLTSGNNIAANAPAQKLNKPSNTTARTHNHGKPSSVIAGNIPAGKLIVGSSSNNSFNKNPGNPVDQNTSAIALVAVKHANSNNRNIANKEANKIHLASTVMIAASLPGTNSTAKDAMKVNQAAKVKKDSIDIVTIQNHYKKDPGMLTGSYKRDTVSTEKMAAAAKQNKQSAARQVAATTAPATASAQKTFASNALAKNAYNANAQIIPAASSAAIATTKKKSSRWAMGMEKIDEALDNVKDNIGQMRFSPGLIAGVNTTFFGINSFGGFQLGATGEFAINEHWSLMAELKYIHGFNSGIVITDNYSTYSVPQPGSWEKDSILHTFNFSTLHTIALPISVRYSTGNFTVFAGGNLVYNFAINYGQSIGEIEGAANKGSEPNNSVSKTPFIDNTSFAARFGAGYLFGLSYHVTPMVQLDLRITQTLWDNSKTSSEKLISNDLYKSPSLQFSIGYLLKDNKKKVK